MARKCGCGEPATHGIRGLPPAACKNCTRRNHVELVAAKCPVDVSIRARRRTTGKRRYVAHVARFAHVVDADVAVRKGLSMIARVGGTAVRRCTMCTRYAAFGFPDGLYERCALHWESGMTKKHRRICSVEGCHTWYTWKDEKRRYYCGKHRPHDRPMFPNKRLCKCGRRPSFGFPGRTPAYCSCCRPLRAVYLLKRKSDESSSASSPLDGLVEFPDTRFLDGFEGGLLPILSVQD